MKKKMAGEILGFKKKWIWVDLKKEKKKLLLFQMQACLEKNVELLYKC